MSHQIRIVTIKLYLVMQKVLTTFFQINLTITECYTSKERTILFIRSGSEFGDSNVKSYSKKCFFLLGFLLYVFSTFIYNQIKVLIGNKVTNIISNFIDTDLLT